jgi:hypothetical protein
VATLAGGSVFLQSSKQVADPLRRLMTRCVMTTSAVITRCVMTRLRTLYGLLMDHFSSYNAVRHDCRVCYSPFRPFQNFRIMCAPASVPSQTGYSSDRVPPYDCRDSGFYSSRQWLLTSSSSIRLLQWLLLFATVATALRDSGY